jgi:glucokinase
MGREIGRLHPNTEKGRALLISELLYYWWDPIGVNDEPACNRGEYDSYVPGVIRLLNDGASAQAVADHLLNIETASMGLGRGTQSNPNLKLAERLVDVWRSMDEYHAERITLSRGHAIGIDLGGSRLKTVVLGDGGVVLDKHVESIRNQDDPNFDMAPWAESVVRRVEAFEAQYGAAAAVGLAAPGLPDPPETCIAHLPARLHGIEDLNWAGLLQRKTHVPVLNDARAALIAERWYGAAQGCSQAFLLTLGTGVGGAAIVDGHLLRGNINRAGHLGHISLNPWGPPGITGIPGSLEEAIGECSLEQRARKRYASTRDLVAAHRAGDSTASEIWLRSVYALACGIASLINVLDPELVVIGGGIAAAGDALFVPLREYLNDVEWRPTGESARVVPAQLGEYAGAIGAAHYALKDSAGGI